MEKLLICGDSFAADWTVKVKGKGWVNLLEQNYKVTNLAQAGCSEYKILKQLQSVDLDRYDLVLVSHTSPYRLYVREHPVHSKDILHKNSCLLYSDVLEHLPKYPELKPVVEYFDKYFDIEYAEHMHSLLLQEIEEIYMEVYNIIKPTLKAEIQSRRGGDFSRYFRNFLANIMVDLQSPPFDTFQTRRKEGLINNIQELINKI